MPRTGLSTGHLGLFCGVCLLLLAACGGGPGAAPGAAPGGAVTGGGTSTSVGEALSRLQAQYAAGTISDGEYDRQRRAILTGAGA